MNSQRAKRIRQFLRAKGIDSDQREYDGGPTVALTQDSGRHHYKTMKKYVGLNGRPTENVRRGYNVKG